MSYNRYNTKYYQTCIRSSKPSVLLTFIGCDGLKSKELIGK